MEYVRCPWVLFFEVLLKTELQGFAKHNLGAVFATVSNAPITTGSVVVLRCYIWRPLFPNLYNCLVFQRFWVIHCYHYAQTYQWENKCYHYDFLQLHLVYVKIQKKWWHFCFQWLLLVYDSTNYFHVTKFLHKHQWMYWPNLLCQFLYSVGASMGQPHKRWSMALVCLSHILQFWSATFSNMFPWECLFCRFWSCATMMKPSVSNFRPDEASHWWVSEELTSGSLAQIGYLPWRGLSSHPPFSSLIFLVFTCALICFAFP